MNDGVSVVEPIRKELLQFIGSVRLVEVAAVCWVNELLAVVP